MSLLARRDGFLLRRDSSSSEPRFAGSYTVTAYRHGAQAAAISSGTTATVRAGHGFVVNDKLLVSSAGAIAVAGYRTVSAVTATTLTLNSALSLAVGDYLINLGPDTGAVSPSYDGSHLSIYSDMGGVTAISNERVTVDTEGNYVYWYSGLEIWELIRDGSGAPVAFTVVNFDQSAFVNVKDYGATGDGTTDDTTALNAAIAAGKFIYFPSGTYIVNSDASGAEGVDGGLALTSNSRLLLDPNCTLKAKVSSSNWGNILRLQSLTNVLIEGGQIDGNRAGYTGSSEFGFCIGVWGGSDIRIQDIMLKNAWGDCLIFERGQDASTPTRVYCSNMVCDNARRDGCSAVDLSYGHFVNCTFKNANGTAPQVGFAVAPEVPTRLVSNLLLDNCSFVGNTARGFGCDGLYADTIVLSNCIARGNGSCGFKAYQMTTGISFTGCFAEANNTGGGDAGGFDIESSTDVVLDGCISISNTEHGYALSGAGCARVSIDGCVAVGNTQNGIQANGTNHKIGNNSCYGNSQHGINCIVLTDSLLSGNFCVGNSQVTNVLYDGIQLEITCANVHLVGNTCRKGAAANKQRYGLNVGAGCTAISVSANDLVGGGTTGDFNDAGTGTFKRGNVLTTAAVESALFLAGLRLEKASVNVTGNDAIVTAGRAFIALTNVSGTNTITLNAPSSIDGQILVLDLVALTAGTLTLADSGNVRLSAAWVPNADDTLMLIANGAVWVETARSTN